MDDQLKLITAGVDGVFMYDIIFNNSNRYDPKQTLMLDPDGRFFDARISQPQKFEKTPLWVKGVKVLKQDKCIFCWSQVKASFYDLKG